MMKKQLPQRTHVFKTVIPAVFLVILGWASVALSESSPSLDLDRFIDPDTCAGCHYEKFEQWSNSMHNLSHKDPVYTRVALFLRQGLTDQGEIDEAESCVKCHTPVGGDHGIPGKTVG